MAVIQWKGWRMFFLESGG